MKVTMTNSMDGKNYPKAIDNAVERMLVEAGIMVEGDAVMLAPVDTGRVKGSITYATNRKRTRVRGVAKPGDEVSTPMEDDTVYIGTNVEYAQHLEYGTKHMAAQPFLRPAFDGRKSDIMRRGLKEVHEGLKRGK